MDIEQLETDALQRFEDYAALTVEALAARLQPMGFTWEPPGAFFTHAAAGVTVTFGAGGYRVSWPLSQHQRHQGFTGVASVEFDVAGSSRLPCDLAQHLVWAWEWRRGQDV